MIKYSAVDASVYLSLSAVTAVLNAFVSAGFGPDLLILVSAVILCRELQIALALVVCFMWDMLLCVPLALAFEIKMSVRYGI